MADNHTRELQARNWAIAATSIKQVQFHLRNDVAKWRSPILGAFVTPVLYDKLSLGVSA